MNKNNKTKKILIVTQAMEIGGAEKALLGLLEAIEKKNVVDVRHVARYVHKMQLIWWKIMRGLNILRLMEISAYVVTSV